MTSALDTRLAEARTLAQTLLVRHGLGDWQFGFNRRKTSLGICRHRRKSIELSVHLVERNDLDEVRETLLHEIAHALVGPGHGHDDVWKAKALEVGARPEVCGKADMPEGRWKAVCGHCGMRFHRHRRPKWLTGWYCIPCGRERGRLSWKLADAWPG